MSWTFLNYSSFPLISKSLYLIFLPASIAFGIIQITGNTSISPTACNTDGSIVPVGGRTNEATIKHNATIAVIASPITNHSSFVGNRKFITVYYIYAAFCTVQPSGIPLAPVVQPVIFAAFINVPVLATPDTHPFVQPATDMSIARHLM